MGQLGMGELLVVLIIVMLVFGASRLPQLGEGLGKAVRNLKRGLQTDDDIDVTPAPKDEAPRQVPSRSSAGESPREREIADAEVVERKR
ncbi:MAG: twin-arginine translocase TatA/TatE family subunit [Polyangiaceae bacterium]|nr:twin-arginine translocase TatA/TatE family subunit [Polyangiaceae bacterium]